jgi:sterol desaturase/sphingolipid hydroxylase (fatty acid hydroxylase superfamily)
VFDHEVRPCGAVNISVKPVTSLAAAALPSVILLPIDALTSMILFMGAMLNGVIWSKLHSEMHRPTNAWICRWSFFKYLRRLHFLHHRHPGTNFNTLYLMWDWIFGTAARPTPADITEMKKMGTWRVRGGVSPGIQMDDAFGPD